jgi:hypothetical protein
MTGLDLVSVQDAIYSHITSTLPSYEIKEDDVLDNESLLRIDNRVKPFIVLRWHGLARSTLNTSFAGVRHDEYSSAVDIVLVAPTPKQARQGLNYALGELIGWVIPGGSQLTPEGGSSVFPAVDYDAKPHIYLAVSTLSFQVNSDGVGA